MADLNKYKEEYYQKKYIKYKSKYVKIKQKKNLVGGNNNNNPAL
jgi:hypothetical protein